MGSPYEYMMMSKKQMEEEEKKKELEKKNVEPSQKGPTQEEIEEALRVVNENLRKEMRVQRDEQRGLRRW